MKAIGYTRVSREEQALNGSISLAVQRRAIEGYCKERGIGLIEIAEDPGFSAKNGNRRGFQRVRQAALGGEVQAVVVYRLDRLTRNLRDLANLFGDGGELRKKGVAFLSVSEAFDTSTPAGAAMMQMLGVFAELERKTIAQRQKAQVAYRQQQGEYWGHVPYGWRAPAGEHRNRKAWAKVEAEQRVLRRIRALRGKGHSLRSIADKLNADSIPSPRGGRWNHVALRKMVGA